MKLILAVLVILFSACSSFLYVDSLDDLLIEKNRITDIDTLDYDGCNIFRVYYR